MAPLTPSPEVLALGRALVTQLGLDDRNDLLARWMAHDIAAKMAIAEANPEDNALQTACAEAILRLWAHRSDFPLTKRPFVSLDPIVLTLARLDPDNETPLYYRPGPEPREASSKPLQAARAIDETARMLIGHLLGQAVRDAGDEAGRWADLAEAAENLTSDVRMARIVALLGDRAPSKSADRERERLTRRLKSLASFEKAARALRAELKAQLAALDEAADSGEASPSTPA